MYFENILDFIIQKKLTIYIKLHNLKMYFKYNIFSDSKIYSKLYNLKTYFKL